MRAVLVLLALASQPGPIPDSRGEIALTVPEYRGVRATAPIPPSMHVRNEGGIDGAGLCVIASILANGQYQGVPGLEGGTASTLWRTAKRRPGGYSPDKLERLVSQVLPDEKWASYVGRDPSILDKLSRQGYPIGATMNTGALYGYRRIHHMISLIHYRTGEWASVVDNNDPGKYHWMPAAEFARRWVDGAYGWAWIWTRLPARPALFAGVSVAAFALLALLLFRRLRTALTARRRLAAAVLLVILLASAPVNAQVCHSGRCRTPPRTTPARVYAGTEGVYAVTLGGRVVHVRGVLRPDGYVLFSYEANPHLRQPPTPPPVLRSNVPALTPSPKPPSPPTRSEDRDAARSAEPPVIAPDLTVVTDAAGDGVINYGVDLVVPEGLAALDVIATNDPEFHPDGLPIAELPGIALSAEELLKISAPALALLGLSVLICLRRRASSRLCHR
jgi:hypothetical protein